MALELLTPGPSPYSVGFHPCVSYFDIASR